MRVVADASVAVAWFLPGEQSDGDGESAVELLTAVRNGDIGLLEPPHWLAEVAAVLSRLSPKTASDDVMLLIAMRIPVLSVPELYATACKLAIASEQHVFDTLYHAIALLTPDTLLVTADARYYKKTKAFGAIQLLRDFECPQKPGNAR